MMDLICGNCGEMWDMYYVLHEDRESFTISDGLITACPCCEGREKELDKVAEARALAAQAAASVLGDDFDGQAAALADVIEMGF